MQGAMTPLLAEELVSHLDSSWHTQGQQGGEQERKPRVFHGSFSPAGLWAFWSSSLPNLHIT